MTKAPECKKERDLGFIFILSRLPVRSATFCGTRSETYIFFPFVVQETKLFDPGVDYSAERTNLKFSHRSA